MKKTVLKKYAELIVRKGVNVQKGQEVVVTADLDQPEFVLTVVEAAYRAGASTVSVDWSYQPLSRVNLKHRSLRVLSRVEKWEEEKARRRSEVLPCMIHLISEDPDGLSGINQSKYAKSMQARMKVLKPYRDLMENKYQWVIAAVPGKKWAKKVFPTERTSSAVEHLWEAILTASRADGPDPSSAWDDHNASLASRCRTLNSLGLRKLRIRSQNGTDLTVGLIEGSLFMGGAESALGSGIVYNPNIPSEEIFITPKRGEAEGFVRSSLPFSYRGQLIRSFSVKFEGGKAVEITGETARETEILKQMISMDEGASFLGEFAMVPYSSPIRKSGILFYNTLFDENAACHLALGAGFSNCLKDYENYTFEQAKALGINDSVIHEDFMVGTSDTEITGITSDGREIPLFKRGEWAF